jgi:hypothetical protein
MKDKMQIGSDTVQGLDGSLFLRIVLCLLLLGAPVFTSCGGGGTTAALLPPSGTAVSITISPTAVSVGLSGTQVFTANVTGSSNTAVTWIVREGAAGGSITVAGMYTAPSTEGTYHVVVTSQADSTKSATAAVLVAPISVAITPTAIIVGPAGTHTFTASVKGSSNAAVTWAVQEGAAGGVITSSGSYSAPSTLGTYHVVATSVADTSKSATATVTVVSSGFFTPTGSMGSPRTLHTATLLRNGKVLVAGGGTTLDLGVDLFILATAELFDPVTGAFTPAGRMGVARAGHTATLLQNGKVLIAGGGDLGPTAEIYDPAGDSFTPTGRSIASGLGHTATLLPNGKVLMAGGRSATAEVYDPATGSFTLTGSMGTAREDHTATLLPDGRVLVVGGTYFIQNPDGTFTFVTLTTAEAYDPTTGTFTPTGSMGTARQHHTATLLPDGRVLVVGGGASGGSFSGALATAEIYNPATGSFTPTGSMGTARGLGHDATLLLNGKVLVTGGIGINLFALETAELYDPATGAFTATGTMGTARDDHTQTLLLRNGKVLVTGGRLDGTIATSELYE